MYTIIVTEHARRDLRDILHYISYELCAPNSALRLLNKIENKINGLETSPERFKKYDKEPWASKNLREMVVDNYLVFYIPDHETKIVTVLRIVYAGRDIDSQLIDQ